MFGYFYMIQAAMPHLKDGSSIINTSSVTAYKGSPMLLDYSATKGAQVGGQCITRQACAHVHVHWAHVVHTDEPLL